MNHYLYILPFKDKKHFKIGISSNSFTRVLKHDKTYGVNFESSFIYLSKKRTITALESLFLSITNSVDGFEDMDGHTEIRKIEDLDKLQSLMDNFSKQTVIKKKKLLDVIDEPLFTYKVVKPRPKKVKKLYNCTKVRYKPKEESNLQTISKISENISDYNTYALFDVMILIYIDSKKLDPIEYMENLVKKHDYHNIKSLN